RRAGYTPADGGAVWTQVDLGRAVGEIARAGRVCRKELPVLCWIPQTVVSTVVEPGYASALPAGWRELSLPRRIEVPPQIRSPDSKQIPTDIGSARIDWRVTRVWENGAPVL